MPYFLPTTVSFLSAGNKILTRSSPLIQSLICFCLVCWRKGFSIHSENDLKMTSFVPFLYDQRKEPDGMKMPSLKDWGDNQKNRDKLEPEAVSPD